MFKFIVLVAIFGLAAAVSEESAAETKSLENKISPEGDNFHYNFQTSNGIDVNSAGDANVVSGSFEFVSPEGKTVVISYTADANGYHPSGDLLPTPPPIPEAIARSIEWNLAHPQAEESKLGRKL